MKRTKKVVVERFEETIHCDGCDATGPAIQVLKFNKPEDDWRSRYDYSLADMHICAGCVEKVALSYGLKVWSGS